MAILTKINEELPFDVYIVQRPGNSLLSRKGHGPETCISICIVRGTSWAFWLSFQNDGQNFDSVSSIVGSRSY